MPDHTHPDITRDIDGLGEKLTNTREAFSSVKTKTGRNETDIQDLFRLSGENTRNLGVLEKNLAGLGGRISVLIIIVVPVSVALIELAKTLLK